jgi:transporter family-2 protein
MNWIMAVPKIGVASALIALVIGQLTTSTIIDHFELIGGRHIPIDWKRIVGLVFLVIALFLFYKK